MGCKTMCVYNGAHGLNVAELIQKIVHHIDIWYVIVCLGLFLSNSAGNGMGNIIEQAKHHFISLAITNTKNKINAG